MIAGVRLKVASLVPTDAIASFYTVGYCLKVEKEHSDQGCGQHIRYL